MNTTPLLADAWTVTDTVKPGALHRIAGPFGDTASLAAFDIAAHVAAGLPWHGQAVRKGRVLLMSNAAPKAAPASIRDTATARTETVSGKAVKRQPGALGLQIQAWKAFHGVDALTGLEFMPVVEVDGPTWYAVRTSIPAGRYDLIVVDDPAWVYAGPDVARTVAGLEALARSTGAAVLIVQDPTVRNTAGRELSVTESGDTVSVRVADREGAAPFRLTVVSVPVDVDGERYTARVLTTPRTVLAIPGLR